MEKKNSYWLGRKHSSESKRKMSESRKGRVISLEWRKHMSEAKQRQKKRDGYINSPEARKKLSQTKTGVARPEWVREKLRGANSPFWKGGLSTVNHLLRERMQYRQWRSDIYTRDNFTCQICGIKGGRLNVDHIKPLSVILKEYDIRTIEKAMICEEIWNLNNGRTLCEKCHQKTETYGNKARY